VEWTRCRQELRSYVRVDTKVEEMGLGNYEKLENTSPLGAPVVDKRLSLSVGEDKEIMGSGK
jgi:hypothetical protein